MPTSVEEAKKHLKDSSVTVDEKWQPLSIGPEQIGTLCGLGIELYFTFIKCACVAFAIWALFQIPMLIFCLHGNNPTNATDLAFTTAFNIGDLKLKLGKTDEIWTVDGLGSIVVGDLYVALGVLDALGLLFFTIILGRFVYRTVPRRTREFDLRNITPSDYSVAIDYLPPRLKNEPEHPDYEEKLKAHIVKVIEEERAKSGQKCAFGNDPVTEISIARDYRGALTYFKGLNDIHEQIDNCKQKKDSEKKTKELTKLETKLEELRTKTKYPIMEVTDRNVKRAYVMLNSCETKEILLNAYRMGEFSITRFFQAKNLRFDDCKLKVYEAPEPGNIMWENQDRNEFSTTLRKLLSLFFTLLCFVISFAFIFAAKTASKTIADEAAACFETIKNQDKEYLLNHALTKPAEVKFCECEVLGLATVNENKTVAEGPCKDWLAEKQMAVVYSLCAVLVVVVINQILKTVVVILTKFERPLSKSAYYVSMGSKLFIAQWFNTAIILILVNSPLFFIMFGNSIVEGGKTDSDDFDRQWYGLVGATVLFTMIIQMFTPHLIQVFLFPLFACIRCCRKSCMETQKDLNALFTHPDFELGVRLAQVMNVVFCSLLFIAGCPLLTVTGCATFFIVYNCDKFLLLRSSKRPPQYDGAIMSIVRTFLPFGILLHACFAIHMLGNVEIFPTKNLIGYELDEIQGAAGIDIGDNVLTLFFIRCLSGGGFPNFIILVLVLVFFVLKLLRFILGSVFDTFISLILASCCGKGKVNDAQNDELEQNRKSSTHLKDSSKGQTIVFSYLVEFNKDYAGLIEQANAGAAWREATERQSQKSPDLENPNDKDEKDEESSSTNANNQCKASDAKDKNEATHPSAIDD